MARADDPFEREHLDDPYPFYAHLRAQGFEIKEPTIAPYGMKQLFCHDPDGFVLCFQWKANG